MLMQTATDAERFPSKLPHGLDGGGQLAGGGGGQLLGGGGGQ